jgi:nicotinamide-nucleotide amidase
MALNIQLLLTGDEILAGDILDTNAQFLAQGFKEHDLTVSKKVTVGDNLKHLVCQIQQQSIEADILVINGGLGPTIDDLTAQALALAANVPLETNELALQHLSHWCSSRGYQLTDANKKQAILPKDCTILPNPIGSAVGFKLTLNHCDIYCTPGVPSEMKRMFTAEILPEILQRYGHSSGKKTLKWHVFGLGESTIQQLIKQHYPQWPKEIELGFRASMPIVEVKLTYNTHLDDSIIQLWRNNIYKLLGDHVISQHNESLPQVVLSILSSQKKKITFAESCTGGLISSLLTQLSGSSQVFDMGFVTYSNQMKHAMLAVPLDVLETDGAVSENTVIAMLKGALDKTHADIGVAVSGIAGPSGGTEDKPVGIVWLAWGTLNNINTCCLYLPYERKTFQLFVAHCGFDLIRRQLLQLTSTPEYLISRKFAPKNGKSL